MRRTSVLVRLRPEILTRVDQARGALPRNQWIVNAILSRLEDFEESDALWQVEQHQTELGEPEPLELAASSPEQGSPSHPVDSDEQGEPNGSDNDGNVASSAAGPPVPGSPPLDDEDPPGIDDEEIP